MGTAGGRGHKRKAHTPYPDPLDFGEIEHVEWRRGAARMQSLPSAAGCFRVVEAIGDGVLACNLLEYKAFFFTQ